MRDPQDIVELVRLRAELAQLRRWKAMRQAGQESVDIALLKAEVERLDEDNGLLRMQLDDSMREAERLRGQDEVHWKTRRHLVAEIKRLRAALEDMLGDDDIDPYVFEHMSDMERYVRNALADQPSGKP